MAAVATFKQECPSCEAMVTVKETQVGKKVECHKCKDKFVAEAPAQKKTSVKKESAATKKNTVQKKADTRVTSKAPASGKKTKTADEDDDVEELNIEIEEEEEEIEIEEEDDDTPQTKAKGSNGKSKAGSNGKGKPPAAKSKKAQNDDEEEEEVEAEIDEDEDEDDKPTKSKKKDAGSGKMTIGLVLAGVGVVVLCVAAYFVLRPTGGGAAKNLGQIVDNKPGEKPNPDIKPPVAVRPVEPSGGPVVALNDAEIARLSNLLPNDSEHVVHVGFNQLFSATSPLREAAFQTPGALVEGDLKKRTGFSPLAIDDLMRAEKNTTPAWSYTVVHFKEAINEADLKTALKLTAAGAPIDGQAYYRITEANPYFDQLARFSLGIPNQFLLLSRLADPVKGDPLKVRPTLVHFQNSQTMIVGDEAPVLALLKAKGQFPLLTPRPGAQPGNPDPNAPKLAPGGAAASRPGPGYFTSLDNDQDAAQPPAGGGGAGGPIKLEGTIWEGSENTDGKLKFKFAEGGVVTIDSSKASLVNTTSQWVMKPNNAVDIATPAVPGITYELTIDPTGKMSGTGKDAKGNWPVQLQQGPAGVPNPTPAPILGGPRDEMYLTIKPTLKGIMDRMEARGPDNRDKALFSSATDMDANRVETSLPEFKDRIVRRPRQFWDVTLMVTETRPRIRMLGIGLVQRDTQKFQYRNELICGQEIDAKEIHKELLDRTANQVARFVTRLSGHEIRLPQQEKPAVAPMPPPPAPPMPEDKKPAEATASQIAVHQRANTVDFVLDLILDGAAMTQIHAIAALTAAALRVDMEAAAIGAPRHALAWAGKVLGDKGLSDRGVPENKFPAGAFKRIDAPLRTDREPKNRISWMAGLLPYLGHQSLYAKIKFDQSWRDPGNWMAGRTAVPQFIDSTFPDSSRFASYSDLPVDFGATHYVGIAGVGLDAGAYNRRDPAMIHKRGVLSYDESATLEEVRQGRGSANAILLIQAPHDGLTGVSPWIAGGGATLRGVPEKNSIAPFVLSTDRNGKFIQHQNKRGTYALMADGTVRFITQNVSDDVFKAMCTVGGPAPQGFDLTTNPNTPLVPAPDARPAKKPPLVEKKPVDVKEDKKSIDADNRKDDKKVAPPVPEKTSLRSPGRIELDAALERRMALNEENLATDETRIEHG